MPLKSQAARDLLRSIEGISDEEMEAEFGVRLCHGGTVYDVYDDVKYSSLAEWAEAQGAEKDEPIRGGVHGWDN